MSLLWVTGNYVQPATVGLFKYSASLAEAAEARFPCVRFVARERNDGVAHLPPPSNWQLASERHVSNIRRVLDPAPSKIAELWDAEKRSLVQQELDRGVKAVVVDHLRSAGVVDMIPPETPIVYISHNDELAVRRLATSKKPVGPVKLAFALDLLKTWRVENALLRRSSLVSCITESDAASLGLRTNAQFVVAPPVFRGQSVESRMITGETPRTILLLGSLGWVEKQQNMAQLLRGLLAEPRLNGARIVATTGGAECPALEAEFGTVEFLPFVEDLAPLLSESRVGIIYEPVGGGFKLKSLDYLFGRVPLVIHEGSAEGLPLTADKELLVGDTLDAVVEHVADVIDDESRLNSLQEHAFAKANEVFGPEVFEPLFRGIESLLSE